MKARLHKLLDDLAATFWLVPASVVLAAFVLAIVAIDLDRSGWFRFATIEQLGLYDGGASGARGLLTAIAGSAITVAGTLFSITIAALTLAAGQMGPRLLHNFTRDRGNQATLGIFLGTFVYALFVLRSIRAETEGDFVPHFAVTMGLGLALVCVGALIWFVDHMAGRINVETVIDLVSRDLRAAIYRLTTREKQPEAPPTSHWRDAEPVCDSRRGYLQHIDEHALSNWASANGTCIRMLVRPGDYVFPGAPIAKLWPLRDGAADAIASTTALGSQRTSSADLEFAVRQLVEVALRALSPGINDPHTAIGVLDQLGAALCEISRLELATGVTQRDDCVVLVVPLTDYDGLVDAMFHTIRQNAAGQPSVLIRMLEMLSAIVHCETDPARRKTLDRHAGLIVTAAEQRNPAPADLADIKSRYHRFRQVLEQPSHDS